MGIRAETEEAGIIKSYISGFLRVFLAAFLVVLQVAAILLLALQLQDNIVYFYLLLEIASILIIVYIVNDDRGVPYKVAWICVIALFPLTGHIMFWLWGKHTPKPKTEREILGRLAHGAQFLEFGTGITEEFSEQYPEQSRMVQYLESHGFPLYQNNAVTYYPMGEDVFDAIFIDIAAAKKFVLLNFFIVGEGILWDRLHQVLLRKISEGVAVLFMYDDFGAMLRTEKHFKKKLEAEGFEVRVFNPIHWYTEKLYLNYRSHQKIIVIDGNIGYTGGINLADEYVNLVQRFGVWKDNAVRVTGDAVWGLTVTFLQMWDVCNHTFTDYAPYKPTVSLPQNAVYCQVVSDGPANNPINPAVGIYKQIMYYAKKYLYITTPYLVIEDDLQDALITAKKSGVDVRLITPFIPDKKIVNLLTIYQYGRLLKEGIRIFEYTPGFIHAKTILNETCGIVGTINMDYRSFYLHYECGLVMYGSETLAPIVADLMHTMEISREISYEEWKNRPFSMKVKQNLLSVFATLM